MYLLTLNLLIPDNLNVFIIYLKLIKKKWVSVTTLKETVA